AQEFAQAAIERSAHDRVALVFGNERSGLSNELLAQCHELSTIPTHDEQPSVNLAQAVLLYGYELHQAARARAPGKASATPAAASDGELRALTRTLGDL